MVVVVVVVVVSTTVVDVEEYGGKGGDGGAEETTGIWVEGEWGTISGFARFAGIGMTSSSSSLSKSITSIALLGFCGEAATGDEIMLIARATGEAKRACKFFYVFSLLYSTLQHSPTILTLLLCYSYYPTLLSIYLPIGYPSPLMLYSLFQLPPTYWAQAWG